MEQKADFKVICIDASGSWGDMHLTQGKEYHVVGTEIRPMTSSGRGVGTEEHYHIQSDKGIMIWNRAARFRKVSATAKAASHSQPKDERQSEMEFFKATQPGYCACGILKSMCDYHHG